MLSATGLSPSTADHSRPLHLTCSFITHAPTGRSEKMNPTTPHTQPLPGITCAWFSLLRFRSPLLTESQLFSLPMGTEMFHFPTFPPHSLYIQLVVTRHHSLVLGFPIRTPSDHSSFDNSPRTIAAYHVLHRLLVPRHPPNALKHLQQHLQTHPTQSKARM